jgi:hypothetical protein
VGIESGRARRVAIGIVMIVARDLEKAISS